jgi:hypothetical protein
MESWTKLPPNENYFVCEYGCFRELPDEGKCNHSSDTSDDGRHNRAHWTRFGCGKTPHAFLCNYHYEELVLGVPKQVTWPNGEEFASRIGDETR